MSPFHGRLFPIPESSIVDTSMLIARSMVEVVGIVDSVAHTSTVSASSFTFSIAGRDTIATVCKVHSVDYCGKFQVYYMRL